MRAERLADVMAEAVDQRGGCMMAASRRDQLSGRGDA
jgi:hypothetical protein